MMKIDEKLLESKINIKLGIIEGKVKINENNARLHEFIEKYILEEFDKNKDYKDYPSISSGRKFYRYFKKDPARYRLSSESLIRRLQKGKELYYVNDLVDILNYVSLTRGYPVGLYNSDKIIGDIRYRVGIENEKYIGIGRGELNIQNLPVLSDDIGAFGSTTSDSIRTQIDSSAKNIMIVIFSFDDEMNDSVIKNVVDLMEKYLVFEYESSTII